uniref:BRCT domain-containing protein n=1 Tax=Meloidogyne incognita TaxID=6306 RepID=A0A914NEQ8_MELIC
MEWTHTQHQQQHKMSIHSSQIGILFRNMLMFVLAIIGHLVNVLFDIKTKYYIVMNLHPHLLIEPHLHVNVNQQLQLHYYTQLLLTTIFVIQTQQILVRRRAGLITEITKQNRLKYLPEKQQQQQTHHHHYSSQQILCLTGRLPQHQEQRLLELGARYTNVVRPMDVLDVKFIKKQQQNLTENNNTNNNNT